MLKDSTKTAYSNNVDGAWIYAKHLRDVFRLNYITDVQQHAQYVIKASPFLTGQYHGRWAGRFPRNGQLQAVTIERLWLEQTLL